MRFLITFVMILSIIAFIHLSKTYPTKDVRTQPNNVFIIDTSKLEEPKVEKLISKRHIEYHKGGEQLNYNKLKNTVIYVINKLPNLDVSKNRLTDLVLETFIVETHLGKSNYAESAKRNNFGIAQIRADTAEDVLKILRKDKKTYNELMSFYNFNMSLRDNLLYNVKFSIAMCSEYYYLRNSNLYNEIHTLRHRAKQWKKNYNTYKGAGSVQIYVDRVEKFYKNQRIKI